MAPSHDRDNSFSNISRRDGYLCNDDRALHLDSAETTSLGQTEIGLEPHKHLVSTQENIDTPPAQAQVGEYQARGANTHTQVNKADMIALTQTVDALRCPTDASEKFTSEVCVKEIDLTDDESHSPQTDSTPMPVTMVDEAVAVNEDKPYVSDNWTVPAAVSSASSGESGTARPQLETSPSSVSASCCDEDIVECDDDIEDDRWSLLDRWEEEKRLMLEDPFSARIQRWLDKGLAPVIDFTGDEEFDAELQEQDFQAERRQLEWEQQEWDDGYWNGEPEEDCPNEEGTSPENQGYPPEEEEDSPKKEADSAEKEESPEEQVDSPKDDSHSPEKFQELIAQHNQQLEQKEIPSKKPYHEHEEPQRLTLPYGMTCHRLIPSLTTETDYPDIVGFDMFLNDTTFETLEDLYSHALETTVEEEQDTYAREWMETLGISTESKPTAPSTPREPTKASKFLDGLNQLAAENLDAAIREVRAILTDIPFCTEIYLELLARDPGFLTQVATPHEPLRRVHSVLSTLNRWIQKGDMDSALSDVRTILEDPYLCAELRVELNGTPIQRMSLLTDNEADKTETCDRCGEGFSEVAVRYGDIRLDTIIARGCRACQERRLDRASHLMIDLWWENPGWENMDKAWVDPRVAWCDYGWLPPERRVEGCWDGEEWTFKEPFVSAPEEKADGEKTTGEWNGDDWNVSRGGVVRVDDWSGGW